EAERRKALHEPSALVGGGVLAAELGALLGVVQQAREAVVEQPIHPIRVWIVRVTGLVKFRQVLPDAVKESVAGEGLVDPLGVLQERLQDAQAGVHHRYLVEATL